MNNAELMTECSLSPSQNIGWVIIAQLFMHVPEFGMGVSDDERGLTRQINLQCVSEAQAY